MTEKNPEKLVISGVKVRYFSAVLKVDHFSFPSQKRMRQFRHPFGNIWSTLHVLCDMVPYTLSRTILNNI